MSRAAVLLALVMSAHGQIVGTVDYHRGLEGEGLRPRDAVVWLPPSYLIEHERRYPVLYMHDGQNILDPATSFLGVDWGVDETATRLIAERRMRETIVVGLYNTPDRFAEYGADPELTRRYMAFLLKKVKPIVDQRYRTLPGREDTFVMGSSMGGLISFLLAWHHPDVFGAAACLSPAFSVGDWMNQVAGQKDVPSVRLYVDNGGVGMDLEKIQPGCDRMLEILRAKGFRDGENLEWYLDAGAEHNERAWAARLWRPLEFLLTEQKGRHETE